MLSSRNRSTCLGKSWIRLCLDTGSGRSRSRSRSIKHNWAECRSSTSLGRPRTQVTNLIEAAFGSGLVLETSRFAIPTWPCTTASSIALDPPCALNMPSSQSARTPNPKRPSPRRPTAAVPMFATTSFGRQKGWGEQYGRDGATIIGAALLKPRCAASSCWGNVSGL